MAGSPSIWRFVIGNTVRKEDRLQEVWSGREAYVIKLEMGRPEPVRQQREGVEGLHAGNHLDLPKDGAESRIQDGSGKSLAELDSPPEVLSEHPGGELADGQLEQMGNWS